MRYNPPPGWPHPPAGWVPPPGWKPDPSWPTPPEGWQLWVPDGNESDDTAAPVGAASTTVAAPERTEPERVPDPARPATSAMPQDTAALLSRIQDLEEALAATSDGTDVVELNDQKVLQDVGIYRYHHPLEDAEAYKARLDSINVRIAELVQAKRAVLAADMFTFGGSLAKGRKMVSDLSGLMLRAYNAEADNCVRSLRNGNVSTAKKRLEKAVTAIEKLGTLMDMRVNPDYHDLRVEELELTADYQMKKQEERELERERRAELREQRRAEAELAAEREKLDKERNHYVTVLAHAEAQGDAAAAEEMKTRLAAIDSAIEHNDYRSTNIRAGFIYVISNIGALGRGVVKIGMTRRLEPKDRVRELGDASVPFLYDIHTLFFSRDAITLENELHRSFADRRVNHVNERREFFFATPSEVREVLREKAGGLMLEFTEVPDAPEYFQSRALWPGDAERAG